MDCDLITVRECAARAKMSERTILDLGYVSRQLGHSNPGVTLGIYTHWIRGTRRIGSVNLDRGIGKAKEEKA